MSICSDNLLFHDGIIICICRNVSRTKLNETVTYTSMLVCCHFLYLPMCQFQVFVIIIFKKLSVMFKILSTIVTCDKHVMMLNYVLSLEKGFPSIVTISGSPPIVGNEKNAVGLLCLLDLRTGDASSSVSLRSLTEPSSL